MRPCDFRRQAKDGDERTAQPRPSGPAADQVFAQPAQAEREVKRHITGCARKTQSVGQRIEVGALRAWRIRSNVSGPCHRALAAVHRPHRAACRNGAPVRTTKPSRPGRLSDNMMAARLRLISSAPSRNSDGKDYMVGYKKPPQHSRFRPGQSRQPRRARQGGAQSCDRCEPALLPQVAGNLRNVSSSADGVPYRRIGPKAYAHSTSCAPAGENLHGKSHIGASGRKDGSAWLLHPVLLRS